MFGFWISFKNSIASKVFDWKNWWIVLLCGTKQTPVDDRHYKGRNSFAFSHPSAHPHANVYVRIEIYSLWFFFCIQRFVLIRYSTAFLTFRIPHIYGTFRYLPWRRELVSFYKVVHSFLSRSNSIEHFMLSHTRSNETSIPSLFEQRMGSEERENSNWKGNTTEMSVVCLMEKSIQFSLSVRFDRIAHSLVTFELC